MGDYRMIDLEYRNAKVMILYNQRGIPDQLS